MKELCRKCKGELFDKVVLNGKGHLAMSASNQLPLKSEGDKKFFVCPHCGAKNIVVGAPPQEGLPQLRISHAED